jgi:Domain of unknown function (DUF4160)
VSSLTFDSCRFTVHSNDHEPRHVHGFLSETEIVIELGIDGSVMLSNRKDAVRPANAKRADIRKLLTKAAEQFDELIELWERVHGTVEKTHE